MDQLFIKNNANGNVFSLQGTSFRITETSVNRTIGNDDGPMVRDVTRRVSHFSNNGQITPPAVTDHQMGYITKSGTFFAITD